MNGLHRAVFASTAIAAFGCAQSTTETLTHAMAVLEARSGASARGAAIFSAANGQVTLQLYVTDATPGMHGVHLHEKGDCSAADALSAGGHWGDLGELGNLEVKEDGSGTLRITSDRWTLDGTGMGSDVTGHSVVLHDMMDTGARVSCGVIRMLGSAGMTTPPPPSGRTATAQLWPRSGSPAYGSATFTEVQGGVEVRLTMSNLTPGNHGAHLHSVGDCSDPAAASSGGHWSLDAGPHGGHVGDFPNLMIGPDGKGTLTFVSDELVVDAPFTGGARAFNDVIGRAVVVHAAEDDGVSQPAGNSGARVSCGVIGLPALPAPTTAVARMDARSGTTLAGNATFREANGLVTLQLDVSGVTPGPHAVHIHQSGDCSSFDALSAGGHWNPGGVAHGLPDGGVHHAGDIGNMLVGDDGRGSLTFGSDDWKVIGADSVLGRALIVHQGVDDGVTQPTGDAGARAGCGLITLENQQPRAPRVGEYGIDPRSGSRGAARLKLTETGNAVTAQLEVFGMAPGPHLVRLHNSPDCSSADALSAGDEWPYGPFAMGTVTVAANGTGRLLTMNPRWLLGDGGARPTPPASADGGFEDRWPDGGFVRFDLAGRSLIVREGAGADAGARISCGVIR